MALTILIKFSGFIVGLHSKPNNMTLMAFPEKIPETRKIVFNFRYLESPCKYLLYGLSVFKLSPKLRVVHIRKKIKISIFSKMALTIFMKICGFIVGLHSKPNNMTLPVFSGKIPETK